MHIWQHLGMAGGMLHPRQPQWGGISFRLQLPGKSRLKLQFLLTDGLPRLQHRDFKVCSPYLAGWKKHTRRHVTTTYLLLSNNNDNKMGVVLKTTRCTSAMWCKAGSVYPCFGHYVHYPSPNCIYMIVNQLTGHSQYLHHITLPLSFLPMCSSQVSQPMYNACPVTATNWCKVTYHCI